MSNLSTLPKGDSAWLFRKAIERIMKQISVLETNIGSSTTGNSNDTEIIFNDAGTLRGDKDFAWNKTSNILTVDGSATITGDLTVKTNVLKVDTTNNRVGIGTATPAAGAALSVLGTTSVSASDYTVSSTWASRFQAAANNQPSGILLSGLTSGGSVVPGSLHVEPVANSSRSALIATYAADSAVGYFAINRFSPSAGTTSQHFKIDDTGVATWSNVGGVAGTAMTLNSTGLGVGKAPLARLDVASTRAASVIGGIVGTTGTGVVNDECQFLIKNVNTASGQNNGAGIGGLLEASASNKSSLLFYVDNGTAVTNVGRFDSNGNFGIGVTPSAWESTFKAIQINNRGAYISATSNSFSTAPFVQIGNNGYYDVTNSRWEYVTANAAAQYVQAANTHLWYTAAPGAVDAPITDFATAKMTLDASGRLLVNTASVIGGSGDTLQIAGKTTAGTDYCSMYTGTSTTVYGARYYHTSAVVGSITFTALGTAYNIASDYRLKEAVAPLTGGLARVSALKPSIYKWKVNGSDGEGFIAHELAEVIPAAVTGQKDAVNEDGSIQPQQVDLSKIVPVLVAAIQELTARVQTLETR